MRELETLIVSIIILIFSFVTGVFSGLSISDKSTQSKLCKQLYTNTTNYLNCKSDHDIYKYMKRVKPIE